MDPFQIVAIDPFEALTDYIHNIDRVMGTGKLTMYDCKDAAESVLGEDELPSADVVEVVRCKDCIHNGSFDTDCPIDWAGKDYCSFGERKDE